MLRYFDRPEVVSHLIEASKAELARAQRTVPGERTQAEKALATTQSQDRQPRRPRLHRDGAG